MHRKFNEFLEEAGRGSDDFPKSLDKLSAAGIRLVQADSNDPDSVGFVQWRVAWYSGSSLTPLIVTPVIVPGKHL